MTPAGTVTWSFGDASGPNLLDKPSLAVRLPNGLIAANDDYGDRVILIDPRTRRIVWQYGHTGVASSAPGYLSKPDGLDFLPAKVVAAHGGARGHAAGNSRSTIGRSPRASRIAAVALGPDRVMLLGGLAAGSSSDQILAGPPGHFTASAPCPSRRTTTRPCCSASGLPVRRRPGDLERRRRPDHAGGRARPAGTLGEPLSDLGAAVVGNSAYIAGGYTGTQYATGILAFRGSTPQLVARLPAGLRYAGVASLGGRIYVAGGITTAGTSSAVYRFDPRRHGRAAGDAPASLWLTRPSSRSADRSTW